VYGYRSHWVLPDFSIPSEQALIDQHPQKG